MYIYIYIYINIYRGHRYYTLLTKDIITVSPLRDKRGDA